MNLKILFVMSVLALSTLAIASPEAVVADEYDIEAQIIQSVEDSAGARLQGLSKQH